MTPEQLAEKRQRTRKAPEERRAQILDAALSVFVRKGLASATIEDITAAAGVAKGTFYLYFDSKEQVVAALRDHFIDDAMQHATGLLARVGVDDWWALVDTTIEAVIDWHLERRDVVALLFSQGMAVPETRGAMHACELKLIEMFGQGIRAGVAAGAFQTADADMTARMLFHAIDGALMNAVLFGEPDRDRLVATATELSHKALAPAD